MNELNNQNENTLMVMDGDERFIADLTSQRVTMFCSMVAKDNKEKAILFKAMNNPDKRIGDCINMTIEAKDVFCEVVQCTNKETGETDTCPRIVLIDKNGVGYQAVSLGIFSALKKLIQIYGQPTWKDPVKIKVVQITKGDRKLLTFDVVS